VEYIKRYAVKAREARLELLFACFHARVVWEAQGMSAQRSGAKIIVALQSSGKSKGRAAEFSAVACKLMKMWKVKKPLSGFPTNHWDSLPDNLAQIHPDQCVALMRVSFDQYVPRMSFNSLHLLVIPSRKRASKQATQEQIQQEQPHHKSQETEEQPKQGLQTEEQQNSPQLAQQPTLMAKQTQTKATNTTALKRKLNQTPATSVKRKKNDKKVKEKPGVFHPPMTLQNVPCVSRDGGKTWTAMSWDKRCQLADEAWVEPIQHFFHRHELDQLVQEDRSLIEWRQEFAHTFGVEWPIRHLTSFVSKAEVSTSTSHKGTAKEGYVVLCCGVVLSCVFLFCLVLSCLVLCVVLCCCIILCSFGCLVWCVSWLL
jgi:hypothetical protein